MVSAQGCNLLYNSWIGKSKGSKGQSLRHFKEGFAPTSGKPKPLPMILTLLADDAKK